MGVILECPPSSSISASRALPAAGMPSTRRHSEFDLVAGCDLARPGSTRPRYLYGIGLAQQWCVRDRSFVLRRCHYSKTGTDGPPDWCTFKIVSYADKCRGGGGVPPFGCAYPLPGALVYRCEPGLGGGCDYSIDGHPDWCTFKDASLVDTVTFGTCPASCKLPGLPSSWAQPNPCRCTSPGLRTTQLCVSTAGTSMAKPGRAQMTSLPSASCSDRGELA